MTAENAADNGISDADYGGFQKRIDHLRRRISKGHPRGFSWVMDELQRIIEGKFATIPYTFTVISEGKSIENWDEMMGAVGGKSFLQIQAASDSWNINSDPYQVEKGSRRLILFKGRELVKLLVSNSIHFEKIINIRDRMGLGPTTPEDLLLFRLAVSEAQLNAIGIGDRSNLFATHNPLRCGERGSGLYWALTVLGPDTAYGSPLSRLAHEVWHGAAYALDTSWFLFRLPTE